MSALLYGQVPDTRVQKAGGGLVHRATRILLRPCCTRLLLHGHVPENKDRALVSETSSPCIIQNQTCVCVVKLFPLWCCLSVQRRRTSEDEMTGVIHRLVEWSQCPFMASWLRRSHRPAGRVTRRAFCRSHGTQLPGISQSWERSPLN